MARKAKTGDQGEAGPGHNKPPMTEAEREALFVSHLAKCRRQNKILADAMEEIKEIRSERRRTRKLARDDGFPLAKIDDILIKEGMTQKDLQEEADLFRWMDQMAGMPVGGQVDLFATMPVEVKDALDYEAEGYRAGMRAEARVPPSTISPRFHADWLKGYGAGQERNAWAMAERGTVVDRATHGDEGAGQAEDE